MPIWLPAWLLVRQASFPIAVPFRLPAVAARGGPLHVSAELTGGAVTLLGLGILTLAGIRGSGGIRGIGRRRSSARG
ncbi:hypothetical protein GCM10022384_62190 [Streptomyces marokkonensis]|uniref:Uncharacterized protein n=1 Tax=Streptomyces marokkonensis TaxID=324855 RepID=A0ABP7S7D7_9ACTN